jgi:hypothetical protein
VSPTVMLWSMNAVTVAAAMVPRTSVASAMVVTLPWTSVAYAMVTTRVLIALVYRGEILLLMIAVIAAVLTVLKMLVATVMVEMLPWISVMSVMVTMNVWTVRLLKMILDTLSMVMGMPIWILDPWTVILVTLVPLVPLHALGMTGAPSLVVPRKIAETRRHYKVITLIRVLLSMVIVVPWAVLMVMMVLLLRLPAKPMLRGLLL